jgi:rhodanese-related sulfurtransferase
MTGRTLDDLLADARAKIARLTPAEALAATQHRRLILDIRSDAAREQGVLPGSIHVPRTVLERRVAPDSAWRNPHIGGVDRRLVVLCDHGQSSSLAAATLVDLGFAAGDVIGGFEAWRDEGLPLAMPSRRSPDKLPGMGPPERWL